MSGLFCCCRAGGYSPVCGSPYRHQAHQREAFFIFRGYKKSMGRAVLKTSGYRDLTRPSLWMSTISNRRRNSALGTYIWETIFLPPIPFIWVSRVSPKIWVLLLLPKLRVVSVVSWSSCKSATHPPASAMSHYQSSDVRDVASFSPSGDYPVTDGLTACASTTKEFAGSFKLLTTSHLTGRAFLTFYNAISQVTLCVPPCTPRQ